MAKVEEIKPKVWTSEEAYHCGKGGFRIKVGRDGNPFKGDLSRFWLQGWNDAAAAEPPIKRRIDYVIEEPVDEHFQRQRAKFGRKGIGNRDTRPKNW